MSHDTPQSGRPLTEGDVALRFGLNPAETGNRPRGWAIVDDAMSAEIKSDAYLDIPTGSLVVHTRDGASNPISLDAVQRPNCIGTSEDSFDRTYRDYYFSPLPTAEADRRAKALSRLAEMDAPFIGDAPLSTRPADADKGVEAGLIERLRRAANGLLPLKTNAGDYGLCDEAAAALEAAAVRERELNADLDKVIAERDRNWDEYLAERKSRMEHGAREAGYIDRLDRTEARAADLLKALEAERDWHDRAMDLLTDAAREASHRGEEADDREFMRRANTHYERTKVIDAALAATQQQDAGKGVGDA